MLRSVRGLIEDKNELESNDRIEQIKELLLDDEAIGEAIVYGITAVQSVIQFDSTNFDTQSDFQEGLIAKLQQFAPFSPRSREGLNEGFLNFQVKENQIDFHFIREIAFRWEFVSEEREIESIIAKKVDSSYRVRIVAIFEKSKVTITFFGGTEPLVIRARDSVLNAIKLLVHNFSVDHIKFSPIQMEKILNQFGEKVTLLNIDPRDNEKYTKFIEKLNEDNNSIARIMLYDIFSVRMNGLQITISPEVKRLIKEEGIRIMEIRGSLFWGLGIKITARVRSSGRVEFFIPSWVVKNQSESAYLIAMKLYAKIIPNDEPPEKGPLERFL